MKIIGNKRETIVSIKKLCIKNCILLIKNALKGVRKMKSIATKDKNKPRRIYYDHLIRNNTILLAEWLYQIMI